MTNSRSLLRERSLRAYTKERITDALTNIVSELNDSSSLTDSLFHVFGRALESATLHIYILREERIRWTDSENYRQTKIWLPVPNLAVSKQIVALPRKTLSTVVNLITGHNWLNYHNVKILLQQYALQPQTRRQGLI